MNQTNANEKSDSDTGLQTAGQSKLRDIIAAKTVRAQGCNGV